MLRERVDEIGVLVPQTAYSAATLLALGADEVVMHPFANLGPIDPQITTQRKGADGRMSPVQFGAEDMEGFLDFARRKVGLSDQANMLEAFKLFCAEAGPIPIGVATRSSQLSHMLGVKLLCTRKHGAKDDKKAKGIVDRLNKQYFNHGYALSRREAKEIGLKVVYPDSHLEETMWKTWLELESDFKARTPFNPMTVVAKRSDMAALFSPPPSVEIPGNMPPQLRQQVWQNILSNTPLGKVNEIEYTFPRAALESVRRQRMYIEKGRIAPFRAPTGGIGINLTKTSEGWGDSIDSAT